MTDLEKIYLVEHYWELDRYISENIYELEDYRGTEIFQENVLKWIIGIIVAGILAIIGIMFANRNNGGGSSGGGGGSSSSSSQKKKENNNLANSLVSDYDKAIEDAKQKKDIDLVEKLTIKRDALFLYKLMISIKNSKDFFVNIDQAKSINFNFDKMISEFTSLQTTIQNRTGMNDNDSKKLNEYKEALVILEKYKNNSGNKLCYQLFTKEDGTFSAEQYESIIKTIKSNRTAIDFDLNNLLKDINTDINNNISSKITINIKDTLNSPSINIITNISKNQSDDDYIKNQINNFFENFNKELNTYMDATIIFFYLCLVLTNIQSILLNKVKGNDKESGNNDPSLIQKINDLKENINNLLTLIKINNINIIGLQKIAYGLYNESLWNKIKEMSEVSDLGTLEVDIYNQNMPEININVNNDIFKIQNGQNMNEINTLNEYLTDQNIINFDSLKNIQVSTNNSLKEIQEIKVYSINDQFDQKSLKAINNLIKKYFLELQNDTNREIKSFMDNNEYTKILKEQLSSYQSNIIKFNNIDKRFKELNSDDNIAVEVLIQKQLLFFKLPKIYLSNQFNINKTTEAQELEQTSKNTILYLNIFKEINGIKVKSTKEELTKVNLKIISYTNIKASLTKYINDFKFQLQKAQENIEKEKENLESKKKKFLFIEIPNNTNKQLQEMINEIDNTDILETKYADNIKKITDEINEELTNKDLDSIDLYSIDLDSIEGVISNITNEIDSKIANLNTTRSQLETQLSNLDQTKSKEDVNAYVNAAQINNNPAKINSLSDISTQVQVPNGDEGASGEEGKETGGGDTPKSTTITSDPILQKLENNPDKIPEIFEKWLQGTDVKTLQSMISGWGSASSSK